MRKIIATARVSLDGVMQGPGAAQEDTSDGFDLADGSLSFEMLKVVAQSCVWWAPWTNLVTCC